MKKLIKDLATKSKAMADYIKDLSRYLSMRDKMLWTGSLGAGQSLPLSAAEGINKYKKIRCRLNIGGYYDDSIICEHRNGAYIGTAFLESWSTGAMVTCQIRLLPNSSWSYYLSEDSGYMTHAYKSNHSELYPLDTTGYHICAIEGVEPYMPESLKNIGGGYYLDCLRRWCGYENLHCLKKHLNDSQMAIRYVNGQQHFIQRLCDISEWAENMLGIFLVEKVRRHNNYSNKLFVWSTHNSSRIFVLRIMDGSLLQWSDYRQYVYFISDRFNNPSRFDKYKTEWNILCDRLLTRRGCLV